MTTNGAGGIWVVAEQVAGRINSVSYELLNKAQQLKNQLQKPEPVVAVILGKGAEGLEQLSNYGAEEIITVFAEELEIYQNDLYVAVLQALIEEKKPSIVLIGATAIGQDLAPMLGARLKTGVAAHCVDVRINENNQMVAVVPAFGGKVLGDILCPNTSPQMATLKPGVLGKPVPLEKPAAVVTAFDPSAVLQEDQGRIKALEIVREEQTGVPLEEAEVIVAGGWGIGSRENWDLVEELARLLGGAVGCTRPVVDEQWVQSEQQMIGTSGKSVRPKVYLAFGISGATHHLCGMKDSGLVISVNKDATAPIFEASDVRIVGDARTILTALIKRIKG
ncbi:MAG TPA: electron transfer flavoprotein subunit alpha/FixB family protein [Peptococcaceae bacterium]|jgi:electron transfer flavoprotein alpha subunit|nr:electron transfer flavoprotein subunit alpha/FixB family protein [Clostridia bacterium]HOB81803.1 electron transfer flavoprotein subunit alpha/FixB family protein [Peptococcaceae bacterium]HQD53709.1 electron transfer flavoprotein subunit alpha/FixB family protein [Peptococcaceae bacterium]